MTRRVLSWFDQERRAPYKVRRGAEGFLADSCQLLIIPDAHRHRDDDDDGDLLPIPAKSFSYLMLTMGMIMNRLMYLVH